MNSDIYQKIKSLADTKAVELTNKVNQRLHEMSTDDQSHYLIYHILGVPSEEGYATDVYQNKGRFLYKYAGDFLEEAAVVCIQHKYPDAGKIKIKNPYSNTPKTFEIDCLVESMAHEIKWRDATTDGDHIAKERTRVRAIKVQGYVPIRIMFYYPQRKQAIKIQTDLAALYDEVGGRYYCGSEAWHYIHRYTGINLFEILTEIERSRYNDAIQ